MTDSFFNSSNMNQYVSLVKMLLSNVQDTFLQTLTAQLCVYKIWHQIFLVTACDDEFHTDNQNLRKPTCLQ